MTKTIILSSVAALALGAFSMGVSLDAAYATDKVQTRTSTTTTLPNAGGTVERTTVMEQTEIETTPVTVTKTTAVEPKIIEGAKPVNFSYLDMNGDGILSRKEVGQKLFYLFDTDGNGVIDNIEITKNQVITIIPLEKTQLTMIDWDDDGKADVVDVTADEFMAASMLNRFDKDDDGLTAEEFIGHSVLELDTNKSGMVEFAEWKEVYDRGPAPEAAKQERYQQ